ncbi:serine hydrolase [Geminicoccus roseus]|uniref:serine hydrolase n=1 Tax=Geminicoccus roseus TaxID=404900 RepID=UPI0004151C19|nr:serine hydrolase [Geminicoccus roseus]
MDVTTQGTEMREHGRGRNNILALLALLLGAGPAGAEEQAVNQPAALERLFEQAEIRPEWFTADFLAQVPLGQVEALLARLARQYGQVRGVAAAGEGRFVVSLERATVPATVTLDEDGRITALLLEPPVASAGGLDEHVAAIAALPGQTSVLVTTDGKIVAAHRPEAVMAVGSAGKLAILEALRMTVEDGRLRWDQVVRLDPAWRSVPSGILQDWPDGSPLTVASLANLLVSLSDNTATDAVLELVGRESVEAISPRNDPFLSTREMFVLKARSHADLRAEWQQGDRAARHALRARLAGMAPPQAAGQETRPTLEAEWYFSAGELCALLESTADLPAFRIESGPAQEDAWHSVAYKGGSEAGVLNLSILVVGQDGARHCVVASWNDDQPLEAERLIASYRGLLRSLRAGAPDG